MGRLLELLRSLGNAGAVGNAGALATARRREDWVIATLQRNVGRAATARPAQPVAVRRTA